VASAWPLGKNGIIIDIVKYFLVQNSCKTRIHKKEKTRGLECLVFTKEGGRNYKNYVIQCLVFMKSYYYNRHIKVFLVQG